MKQAILSMRTGSAGGMDGIRPLHLRQLASADTAEALQRLLASLTALTNLREFTLLYVSSQSVPEQSAQEVLVKIDVKNAFNSVRRDVVLRCMKESCPEVYAMTYQAYSAHTPLLIAGQRVLSSAGVQQGDPIGPIAFALAVNSCAQSLKSPLNVWYLDDATIGGLIDRCRG